MACCVPDVLYIVRAKLLREDERWLVEVVVAAKHPHIGNCACRSSSSRCGRNVRSQAHLRDKLRPAHSGSSQQIPSQHGMQLRCATQCACCMCQNQNSPPPTAVPYPENRGQQQAGKQNSQHRALNHTVRRTCGKSQTCRRYQQYGWDCIRHCITLIQQRGGTHSP